MKIHLLEISSLQSSIIQVAMHSDDNLDDHLLKNTAGTRVWRIIRRVLEYFLHIKLIRQVLQVLYIYNINTMYERILMKIGKMSFWVTNLHNFVE